MTDPSVIEPDDRLFRAVSQLEQSINSLFALQNQVRTDVTEVVRVARMLHAERVEAVNAFNAQQTELDQLWLTVRDLEAEKATPFDEPTPNVDWVDTAVREFKKFISKLQ